MKTVLPAMVLLIAIAATANAQVPIAGKGDTMRLDAARLPQPMKANYERMREKCTKCHSLERVLLPFQTGITPITMQPFDMDTVKSITFNMVRKSNGKNYPISKDEAKSLSALLKYLLDESVR
ncbi:cytochrome C [Geomonas propionica]|uniref:Cytochrome C n=1 Tax=Geomonas propionica TaxID=2798582 RepID=A0ABS0YN48_9BACT|nr:cytochrome C [Geomonas propionica]MBJ6799341.1 cytochrome C [Geomonas propionica]